MSEVIERFLRYVAVDTKSEEEAGQIPSTPGQLTLANMLAEELRQMGAERVRVSGHGYVFAEIAATP